MKESRSESLSQKELSESIPYPEDSPRPSQMTPDDCCYPDAPRPCPLVSCKFNNYLTPTDHGTIILTWPGLEPHEVPPDRSCLLDVIKELKPSPENPMSFRVMGRILGVTGQGAKSMVDSAHKHAAASREEMTGDDDNS